MPWNLHSMMQGGGITLSKVFQLFSNVDTITRVIQNLRGVSQTEGDAGKPNVSQGLTGLLGKGDERTVQILMQKIREEENWEWIPGFLNWHFARERMQDKLLAFWYMSSWRVFLADMKSSNTPLTKVKEVHKLTLKTGEKSDEKTTETTYDTYADSHKPALEHLKHMIYIIGLGKNRHQVANPSATEQECLEAGYQALLDYYKAFGVPTMPPRGETDWFEWAKALGLDGVTQLKTQYSGARDTIQQSRDELEARKAAEGPFSRFLRKYFS